MQNATPEYILIILFYIYRMTMMQIVAYTLSQIQLAIKDQTVNLVEDQYHHIVRMITTIKV